MSPFLSADVIEYFNSDRLTLNGTRRKLFTRRTELPKIKSIASNFDVYVLKDTIIDGEEILPEGVDKETKQQDIHAKMYLRRKYSQNELYLGSMNASNSGISRNIEMMIKLEIKNQYINMDRLCEDFFAGDENNKYNPFEKVDLSLLPEMPAEDDEQDALIDTLKHICRMNSTCEVVKEGNGYAMVVHFDSNSIPPNVYIHPLRVVDADLPMAEEIVFSKLNILHLSEFFVLRIIGKESSINRVIMIPTIGIPEDRDKFLVQGIIKDKKTFIEYVVMALGDDLLQLFGNEQTDHEEGNTQNYNGNYKMPALYEKMLRVAYEDPRRLLEIEPIMIMIDDENIITDDFRQMYDTFKSAMKL